MEIGQPSSKSGRAQRIVFIAGLTHSGSTLLDLILSGNVDCVGLGEIVSILRPESREKLLDMTRRCSCGTSLVECPYWSCIIRGLDANQGLDMQGRYHLAIETFREVFGPDKTLVDSSKSLRALRFVTEMPNVDLKVLHLIRDVRAWTTSRRNLDAKLGKRPLEEERRTRGRSSALTWIRHHGRQNNLARFLIWYHGNRRFMDFLTKERVTSIQVSYELLSLSTSSTIMELRKFLEVGEIPGLSERIQSRSHIALGNPMRHDAEKRSRVMYDYRWLTRNDLTIPALLLPHVMRFNRQLVYSAATGTKQP